MSVNKAILLGNVGKDPDIRYIEQDKCVASFPLATTKRAFTSAYGTMMPERTDWHNIVVWGTLAKTVEKYVKKGQQLYLEGEIRTRSYTDKNQITRYVTEIYCDTMEMLARPKE